MNSGNQTAELQSLSATSIFWKLCTTPGLLLQQNCCLVQKMIWKVRNTVSEKQQHVISISAAFSASLKSFLPFLHSYPLSLIHPGPQRATDTTLQQDWGTRETLLSQAPETFAVKQHSFPLLERAQLTTPTSFPAPARRTTRKLLQQKR